MTTRWEREILRYGRRVFCLVGGMILTALVVLHLYQPAQAQAFKRVEEGKEAPAFNLVTPEGVKLALKDFSGKVVAVCFWKFGEKSEEELVALRQSQDKYKDKGLEVLALYIPDSDEKITTEEVQNIKKLVEEKGLSFSVLIDEGMKTFNDYGVITMPSLAVIDKTGKIVSLYSGFPKFGGDKQINQRLESALGIAPKLVEKEKDKGYVPKGQAGFHYKFGLRFFTLGFLDKAAEKLKESLTEDPAYPAAHLLLAQIYAKAGKRDEAMSEFNLAIAAEPEKIEVHMEYGKFAVANKMYDEAAAEYETVKALNPDSGAGDFGLGQLYLAQEKFAEAEAAFQAAVELFAGKKSQKGSLFGMLKERKAKEVNPDLGPAYYGLAQAQIKTEKKDEALANLQEAIKCYQQNIEQIRKEAAAAAEEKE